MLSEIPSGRGEGPSYMKVSHIESSFKVISNHHCTVFGEGGCSGLRGSMKMYSFTSLYLSVCVYSAGAQKPYMGLLRKKE